MSFAADEGLVVVSMRSLMAARVVVLDSDATRRDLLCRSLTDLGLFGVSGIATVAEALGKGMPLPDVFLIYGPALSANDDGGSISPNPFVAASVSTILLLPDATMPMRRLAVRAGYSIILAAPASPRLLYRRIAHLLQKARRTKRRMQHAQGAAREAADVMVEPEIVRIADPTLA